MQPFAYHPADFHRKALACAHHYGFRDITSLAQNAHPAPEQTLGKRAPATPRPLETKMRKIDPWVREFDGALRELKRNSVHPSPSAPHLFYTTSIDPTADPAELPDKPFTFSLYAFGLKHSIAEALVLKTAIVILEELGIGESYTYLNSIGDRDSSHKFGREATNILRRTIEELPSSLRESFKEDAFLAYMMAVRKQVELSEELPRPMEYLSSASRKHLRDVLEFLEAADIPYIFDDTVTGHRDWYQHTLFELRSAEREDPEEPQVLFARGGRYDEHLKYVAPNSVHAVGITFRVRPQVTGRGLKATLPRQQKRPRVYFIRLGAAAELKSFAIMETLRRARVPTYHSIRTTALSEHLAFAESSNIPYTVIMGQKEALEDSVIVRDTATRAQQTVPISHLSSFFRSTRR
ncbi:hypothetical protein GVX82_03975 [Patescibacteria group bacterium]|jgi:histidyl-tRNA synthetase|nr:hypothetical protein [Patescibacteria group bacterium]